MANRLRGQRHTRRRQPYAWLGAGALGVGLALAGAGAAHADDGVNETASTAAASSARASGNAAAGAAAKSTPRSPAATSRSAGPRQSVNDGAGKRAPTAANRSILAATPRVRSAVPVSAASANAGKPLASERAAQVVVPAAPVQNPPTASATAAVPSEAGDRPLRRPVERAVAAPAPVATRAAVNPAEAINAAVVDWFDSTSAWLATLPRGPLNEWASGALLLVRRSLFNQEPTARPAYYLQTSQGALEGNLYVADPEADSVKYRLLAGPRHGTAQVAADGTWSYTPAPGYTGTDEFSVAVVNPGFNLLDPFSDRVSEISVPVGGSAPTEVSSGAFFTRGYDIVNLTPSSLGLTFVGGIGSRGQYVDVSGSILVSPPECNYSAGRCVAGTVLKPGDTAHFELGGTFSDGVPDVSVIFNDPTNLYHEWIAVMKGDLVGLQYVTRIDGDATGLPGYTDGYTYGFSLGGLGDGDAAAALVPASLKTALTPGEQDSGQLLSWLLANSNSTRPQVAVSMTNVQFIGNPPGDPGYTRYISADNPGDAPGSISRTVSASTSTTNSSSWEVSGKASWSPIEKILGFEVAGKYGKTESETNAKTFTTTVTQTSLPYSANEILTAPPKLLVNGDAQFVVGTGGKARTFSFSGVQFYFPSQNVDAPFYQLESQPLQPKYDAITAPGPGLIGTSIPNVGFTVRDKDSKLISPTYAVGQRAQLTVTAYQGVGATADKTGDPRTKYTSSNPAVAVVNSTGAITAVGPGTAVITARYDWTIPYGDGTARKDYVLATIDVAVQQLGSA